MIFYKIKVCLETQYFNMFFNILKIIFMFSVLFLIILYVYIIIF